MRRCWLRLKAPEEIAENMVLGQYEGYRQEPSVKEDSVTETYAAVRLFIDNDRWKACLSISVPAKEEAGDAGGGRI